MTASTEFKALPFMHWAIRELIRRHRNEFNELLDSHTWLPDLEQVQIVTTEDDLRDALTKPEPFYAIPQERQ